MVGTKTLRVIRKIDYYIRIFVASGFASAPLARELHQQGAYAFFQKSVDLTQLQEAVEQIQTIQDLTRSLFVTLINRIQSTCPN
tara:strand:- start:156 stop:407 length:252 start_codon:yes stop_codon:yes gene_type:complete